MRVLIDIGHPAHVHFFKNFAHEMQKKGHKVLFTLRDKEFEIELLKSEGFDYVSFGKKYKSTIGKIWGLLKYTIKEVKVCHEFHPDVFLSLGSICGAWASWFVHRPNVAGEDTYNMEQCRLYIPFANAILTGNYDHPIMSPKNEIRYNGYHELAYLHPNYYSPDKTIFKELGLDEETPYCILRFVGWNASHDVGHKGISLEKKIKVIENFSKYCKVFISSEAELPIELKKYKLPTRPERIHDVIAYSKLLFGESGTMAEEAAMLGVPSIILYPTISYYTKHLEEDYGLMYNYVLNEENIDKAINKGIELLADKETSKKWKKKRDIMLAQKIDVTQMLVWFIENYPESKKIMQENPDYQMRFK